MSQNAQLPPYDEAAEKAWAAWVDDLVARLRDRAKGVTSSPFCWMESTSEARCERHAGRRSYADATSESDSQRYCERCGMILDHCFTDYGASKELGYSADDDVVGEPIHPEEAFTLMNVIYCGVPKLTVRWPDFDLRSDLRPELEKIAARLDVPLPVGRKR